MDSDVLELVVEGADESAAEEREEADGRRISSRARTAAIRRAGVERW